jgi:succinate dehydrogenase/fumarate reductase flavoprotein subunit
VARALASRVLARQETGRLRRHVGWEVVDLVVDDAGACRGVVAIHTVTLAVETWEAHGVCACPGGYAGLWPRSTSPGRRGELLWACVRRGARLVTPEAAHFHPLVAAPPAPPRPWPWLALAGRGALTVEGEPVAHQGESPHAVTGAILRACQARGLGPVGALLAPDLDGLASPPGAASGHGTAAGPFRVAPAVTRTLGGLEVGWRVSPRGEVEPSPLNGQTALPGLYAAGQVCGGLHGDCALPGDESLATLFTARLAARGMLVSGHKGFRLGATSSREAQAVAETTTQALRALSGCGGEENPFLLGDEAARVVGHAAGLLRCREDLEAGRAQLGGIQQRRLHAATPDAASVLEAWGLDARLALADRVLEAALARPESLGAEQRGDAPGDVTPAADGSAT